MANMKIVKNAVNSTLKRHKGKFEKFLPGWYGWEKWFQVELAYELSSQGEAYVEKQCAYDKNKKLPIGKLQNSNAFIDIIFRKNNDIKDYFSAVELTVGRTRQSLRKVLSDLIKIKAIKNSEWKFRSVFIVLVYDSNYEKNTKFVQLYDKLIEKYNIKPIDFCGFTFLVFGWEPQGLKANMVNSSYGDWVDGLEKVYKEYGVTPKTSVKKLIKKVKDNG